MKSAAERGQRTSAPVSALNVANGRAGDRQVGVELDRRVRSALDVELEGSVANADELGGIPQRQCK